MYRGHFVCNHYGCILNYETLSYPLISLSIYLCRLSLVRVKEEDYGDYFCKASNQLEEDVQVKFFVTGQFFIFLF